jgi:hypothetical protein
VDVHNLTDQDSSVSLHRLDLNDASQIGHLGEDLLRDSLPLSDSGPAGILG